MRIASFVRPHIGGTFTVFRQLRDGLAHRGLELRWVTSGAIGDCEGDLWRDEQGRGDVIDPAGALSPKRRAQEIARLIEVRRFDAVMLNILGDAVETEVARYLAASVIRVAVVHNITPGTYAAARSVRDHVHATVCVSPRGRDDLVSHRGFDPARTVTVLNSLGVDSLAAPARTDTGQDGLRVLFLGRIEDCSKGVMWLPRILSRTPLSTRLTIAGSGPDEARLKAAFDSRGLQPKFLGAVAPCDVPALLAEHDILLMPSRFEGAPMSLIEAMAAGCVPVASRIRGVTDALVEHGRDGMLFPLGDCREASRLIAELAGARERLSTLGAAARLRAVRACQHSTMATDYATLLERLRANPPVIAAPRTFDRWTLPSSSRRPLRSRAPEPVKNLIRLIRERLAASR